MRQWIESLDNLMLMMNLLRDRSRNIQFEAFHVFKVRTSASLSFIIRLVLSVVICSESEEERTGGIHPRKEPRQTNGLSTEIPKRSARYSHLSNSVLTSR